MPSESSPKIKYAFHVLPNGSVDYIGEIVEQDGVSVFVEVVDAISLLGCGLWDLSGEVKTFLVGECRFFLDKKSAIFEMKRANDSHWKRP